MKKKSKLKFIFEKVFSSPAKKIDLINSPQSITDARKLLPELDIPQSETVLPDGKIVKSLFLDYFSDQEYLIAKLIKRVKQQYEKEVKEFEALSAGGANKTTAKKSQPSLPFIGYN